MQKFGRKKPDVHLGDAFVQLNGHFSLPLQVGYETGGAQYQAGLIRGFDPATILHLGSGLRNDEPVGSAFSTENNGGLKWLRSARQYASAFPAAITVREWLGGIDS